MEIDVDTSKWQSVKNRTSPRPQSDVKSKEITWQVNLLLQANAIRPTTKALNWSQALLAPKPEQFCVDYRNMNDATTTTNWQIPNVPQMLQRIGAAKLNSLAKWIGHKVSFKLH
jgi:hypothetical protein